MLKKICYSNESKIQTQSADKALASPEIVERLSKLATDVRAIAPKSEDFLYFSIIFLKSAESSYLDDNGGIKKASNGEDAWGFFDENWRWHGNVPPHRNNNRDIFPESELKKATKKWIGMPLCRDHESSSVDGIRGIILDAHYDDKFKQVVGLCALDKVNYPDLARKVETGLVRYGSMGTAVEVSICSECGNKASTQKEYCPHVMNKTAHGEINVGLKPIEYSLVVQPAEPGAILLKCLASLEEYRTEFINYGVDNVDEMMGRISEKQASHLETIMKTACGENGCNVTQRRKIVTSFLANNGFIIKESDNKDLSGQQSAAIKSYAYNQSGLDTERFTSSEEPEEQRNLTSGVSTTSSITGGKGTEENPNFAAEADVVKAVDRTSPAPLTSVAGVKDSEKLSINQLLEDIMNETNLKKRAELRRRIAYMQGGESVDDKSYREPAGFKSDKMSETIRNTQDRHLLQDGDMNKLTREDMAVKEKLSRAELQEARLRRIAYMQGGDSVDDKSYREPSAYKSDKMSETVRNTQDRHLLQDGDMNKLTREDLALKEKLSRASARGAGLTKVAYNGPSLTTRFSIKRNSNGTINKTASVFEVFSGNKRVIAATAGQIFGADLNSNWDWIKSQGYGQEVCKHIRASGIPYVSGLLKSAQEAGAALDAGAALPPPPDMGAAPAAPDMGALPLPPDMGAMAEGEEGSDEEVEESEDKSEEPAVQIDEELSKIDEAASNVRDLVNELKDKQEADVDVNVFTGKKKNEGEEAADEGKLALSRHLMDNLKKAYRQLDSSADELAMVAETYDNISKLSSLQRREFVKLAYDARKDSARILGEATSLIRIAKTFVNTTKIKKSAQAVVEKDFMKDDYVDYEDDMMGDMMDDESMDNSSYADDEAKDDASELVTAAMNMRKARREAIVKQAETKVLAKRAAARSSLLKKSQQNSDAPLKPDLADDAKDKHHKGPHHKGPHHKAEEEITEGDEKSDDLNDMSALHTMNGLQMGMRSQENMSSGMKTGPQMSDSIKPFDVRTSALNSRMQEKRAEEERESYRIKLRRAYDVGMDMQRKGLLPHTKVALDRQVDDIMSFDDGAFESFKRSIGNAKAVRNVKIASDLGGINVGVESESNTQTGAINADRLLSLWD